MSLRRLGLSLLTRGARALARRRGDVSEVAPGSIGTSATRNDRDDAGPASARDAGNVEAQSETLGLSNTGGNNV